MNKDMIKSLRQAMLSTATAALVSIGFTACSDETFTTQNTPVPANGYKFSIPASMGSGETRAIAYNSETGGYDAMFETSEMIFVYDVTQNAESQKKNDGGYGTTYLYPDANGKTVNLVGELGFSKLDETGTRVVITPAVGDELMLFYNDYDYSFNYFYYFGDKVHDYAIATVTIESIDGSVIKTSPAFFENPQSAYRINFTGISSGVKIKKVSIESAQKKLVNEYRPLDIDWPNYFSEVNYTYDVEGINQHELTFMLRFADNPYNDTSAPGDVITFKALGSDGHYYVGTKSVDKDLNNGRSYKADVAMEDVGLAMTLTNNTTGELVELNGWTSISTKDAGYTVTNTGINTSLSWYGGDQTLTLKNVTVLNSNQNSFIDALSDDEDLDNTKVHKLVLDGVNTLNSGIWLGSYRSDISLFISASPEGGSLTITQGGFSLGENGVLIIESGEVSVDYLYYYNDDNNSVILSGKDAKLRVRGNYSIIKAASGYVLNTATEGDYVVYTVTEAPGT